MRLCIIGKYPPIEGGVSATTYWTARTLAEEGVHVNMVSNSIEVEPQFRMWLEETDNAMLAGEFPGGGRVQLHTTSRLRRTTYIPYANPYVTKLAGLATRVVRESKSTLIFGYYLEPYSVAAYLCSQWTGVPFALAHAGSDIGHLITIDDLGASYREVLQRAGAVLTGMSEKPRTTLLEAGVPESRLITWRTRRIHTAHFNPEAPPLDVNAFLDASRAWTTELRVPSEVRQAIDRMNEKRFDPTIPTIGVFGKVGENKGSFDLAQALSRIKEQCPFNFLALTGGHPHRVKPFVKALADAEILERAWVLPFLPNWRIPSFIRTCTALCFLERRFNIQAHAPRVAREVLACGVCLLCSREIADKQRFRNELVDGQNLVVVEDPADIPTLASKIVDVLSNPARTRSIGEAGAELSRRFEQYEAGTLRRFFERVGSIAAGAPA